MEYVQTTIIVVEFFAILAIIIVALCIILLIYVEKKIAELEKIYNIGTRSKRKQLIKGIVQLKRKNPAPQEILDYVDSFGRIFLNERFGLSGNMGYGEMQEFFVKQGKTKIALFCQKMIEARYSGNALAKEDLDKLLRLLESILTDYEKSLKHEMNEAIRRIYLERMKVPFAKQLAILYFKFKNLIERKETGEEHPAGAEPGMPESAAKSLETYKPTFFKPEKIEIKNYKTPKTPMDNKYIEYVDILDRIKNRVEQLKQQKKLDNV